MNSLDEFDKLAIEDPELFRDMINKAAKELGLDQFTVDDKPKGGVLPTRCPHCGKDVHSSNE